MSCNVTVDLHRSTELSDLCARRSLLHRVSSAPGPPGKGGEHWKETRENEGSLLRHYQEKNQSTHDPNARSDVDPAYVCSVVGKCLFCSSFFPLVQGMLCFTGPSYPEMINQMLALRTCRLLLSILVNPDIQVFLPINSSQTSSCTERCCYFWSDRHFLFVKRTH